MNILPFCGWAYEVLKRSSFAGVFLCKLLPGAGSLMLLRVLKKFMPYFIWKEWITVTDVMWVCCGPTWSHNNSNGRLPVQGLVTMCHRVSPELSSPVCQPGARRHVLQKKLHPDMWGMGLINTHKHTLRDTDTTTRWYADLNDLVQITNVKVPFVLHSLLCFGPNGILRGRDSSLTQPPFDGDVFATARPFPSQQKVLRLLSDRVCTASPSNMYLQECGQVYTPVLWPQISDLLCQKWWFKWALTFSCSLMLQLKLKVWVCFGF